MIEAQASRSPRPFVGFGAGDVLGFVLILVFVRQALWTVPSQALAWGLSAALALAGGLLLRRWLPAAERPQWVPWLVVVVPLTCVWAVRVPFADLGWDVLNYHLLHAERALRGPLWVPGDFFPYYLGWVNPAPDMATGVFRHLLGYRAGTVTNLLALLWTASLAWRLTSLVPASPRARILVTLLVVASEGTLTQLSSYMVDLLALPLVLQVVWLLLTASREPDPGRAHRARLPIVGLLLGATLALKLTHLAIVGPLGLVALASMVRHRRGQRTIAVIGALLLAGALFVLPLVVHTGLLVERFGSPVFPHYNELFKAPNFPQADIRDGRWGPTSRAESLAWPLEVLWKPERFSELPGTTGRLSLVWLVSLAVLAAAVSPRTGARRWAPLAFVTVTGALLWSLSTGYSRYSLAVELAGAALAGCLVLDLLARPTRGARVLGGLLATILAVQSLVALNLVRQHEWGGRPHVFAYGRGYQYEVKQIFRDRDFASYLAPGLRELVGAPAVWVESAPKTNGAMALLGPGAPLIHLRMSALFDAEANGPLYRNALRRAAGRRTLTLSLPEDRETALRTLAERGYAVTSMRRVTLPFYSEARGLPVLVVSLQPPPPSYPPPRWRGLPQGSGAIESVTLVPDIPGGVKITGWARLPGQDLHAAIEVSGKPIDVVAHRRIGRSDLAALHPELGDCSSAGFEVVAVIKGRRNRELTGIFRTPDGLRALITPPVAIPRRAATSPTVPPASRLAPSR